MNQAGQTALLERACEGDSKSLGKLMMSHRERLFNIIRFRLDRRLQGRLEAADVIQETFVEATARFPEFVRDRKMTFFLWLRFLTLQKLSETHRSHLGVQARDVNKEVSIDVRWSAQATSAVLAAQLLGRHTSPSRAAMRNEMQHRLEELLREMNPVDREVLALRHFEQLTNAEAAQVLNTSESAASNRYVRALRRLRSTLDNLQLLGSNVHRSKRSADGGTGVVG
jgi:RNA polymerase sigma-70 factor (ECF subfamily)